MGLTLTEWLMIVLGLKLMVAAGAALVSAKRGKDRRAIVCLVAAVVYFAFLVLAKNKADSESKLKHAAEHHAVQEQVESIRSF